MFVFLRYPARSARIRPYQRTLAGTSALEGERAFFTRKHETRPGGNERVVSRIEYVVSRVSPFSLLATTRALSYMRALAAGRRGAPWTGAKRTLEFAQRDDLNGPKRA